MKFRSSVPHGTLVRATAVSVLAVTLLSSGFGTAARWSDEAALELQTVTTGTLDVQLAPARVVLEHTDLAPGAVSTSETETVRADLPDLQSLPRLAPGDTVTVATRATLDLAGTNLTAHLTVDPGMPDGSPLTADVQAAPELGPPSSAGTWSITSAHSGTYDLTITYRVPLDVPDARRGSSLGTPRPTVTLAQN
ncbi:hypothetical protein [Kocuria sp. U4B]